MLNIGVIIPDRNDRPKFLEHCKYLISRQSLQPDYVEVVNYLPKSKDFDLTERVRIGFERLKNKCDCVLIIENDDWYDEHYIATMFKHWFDNDKPDLLGIGYTYYYHIGKKQYKKLHHKGRASLMNTLISTKANIKWCADNYVFLDLYLWQKLKGVTFEPKTPISLGIKHGVGLCGGSGHKHMWYHNEDNNYNFLKNIVDKQSLIFYKNTLNDSSNSRNLS